MSRLYQTNAGEEELVDMLKAKHFPKLFHFANPKPDSPWQNAVTDGTAYAWLENGMLLVWGSNNEYNILKELRKGGVFTTYIG